MMFFICPLDHLCYLCFFIFSVALLSFDLLHVLITDIDRLNFLTMIVNLPDFHCSLSIFTLYILKKNFRYP